MRDHLRVCGADDENGQTRHVVSGSSPRVRSRRSSGRTCSPRRWDHLRVCGADRKRPSVALFFVWIISACAEQTRQARPRASTSWDHLRVCGADHSPFGLMTTADGSSPRVRSRHTQRLVEAVPCGIISACAEQTSTPTRMESRLRDHLRVCGADQKTKNTVAGRMGSSPRVRSRPCRCRIRSAPMRIISACAEQTNCTDLVYCE